MGSGRALVTITIDIKPEVYAELARQAASLGRTVEAHAVMLLEEAVLGPASSNPETGRHGK